MKSHTYIFLPVTLLVLLFASGCVTPTGGEQLNVLTTEEEIQLGKTMSAEVEKEETPLKNNAIQVYVHTIGERLADQSPRQDVPYEFTVIDNPEVVNAFALPGGHMYVYTGLMKICDNEAQLASVMAHEIAHVAAKHHGEAYTRQLMLERVRELIVARGAGPGTAAGTQVLGQLFALKFSKVQEQEADRMGMDILFRAGYKPESMVDFMRKLAAYEQEQGGGARPSGPVLRFLVNLTASHPATADRIANLDNLLLQYPVNIRNQSPTYFDRYKVNVLDVLK
ncbi:MAG: M48 family metalloprotease [Candidatus Hydrogenedentes bacterium]|nr:M48 family metalloprotease [Candidatus Hydrogenedentota bacterium]